MTRKGRGVFNDQDEQEQSACQRRQEKENQEEEDGLDRLPGQETVLDYADSVLAMGAGRHRRQDRGTTVDRVIQTRA